MLNCLLSSNGVRNISVTQAKEVTLKDSEYSSFIKTSVMNVKCLVKL